MKRITVIYDDRLKPAGEIKEITGEKSFGRIIYKRSPLETRFFLSVSDAAEKEKLDVVFRSLNSFNSPEELDLDTKRAVLLVFSDCIIRDKTEFSLLLKKSGYCGEEYRVMAGGKVAAVVFHDTAAFLSAFENDENEIREQALNFEEILSDAFLCISDKGQFLSFITGGFEARYFNALSGDEYTVVKSSTNKEKIFSEYKFYYLLPENMRSWFVLPYDFKEEGEKASYRMQRYHMTDLAIRYVHGAISIEEFRKILDILFVFLKDRKEERVTWNEFYERRRDLYITKVEKRIEELKKHPSFGSIDAFISNGTEYGGIDGILKCYEDIYDAMIGKNKEELRKTISHGDLCFSNILYSPDTALLRLIDPKGASSEEGIYSDPLYDIAKLSHSVSGRYDFMNSGLYEIDIDDDMKLKLEIDGDVREYRREFENKLREENIDIRTVRLFECSLFLSMLPLHTDSPRKVLAFILNAADILKELKG